MTPLLNLIKRPGVVILNKYDYINKMDNILNDTSVVGPINTSILQMFINEEIL